MGWSGQCGPPQESSSGFCSHWWGGVTGGKPCPESQHPRTETLRTADLKRAKDSAHPDLTILMPSAFLRTQTIHWIPAHAPTGAPASLPGASPIGPFPAPGTSQQPLGHREKAPLEVCLSSSTSSGHLAGAPSSSPLHTQHFKVFLHLS